jgi:LysM repeat protein
MKRKKKYRRYLLLIIAIITLTVLKVKSNSAEKHTYKEIVVYPGDTIWGIAAEHNIYKDINEMIYEIRKINHNTDCLIYPGQTLKIPTN